ncbi:ATP binding [Rhizoctonia solani]|uniref:ATP binding n=1 Tax=Rhizoctonia solani TaxID=456999 RepID=A0A8H7IEB5_9AGAM|nr:ATP binding [Rhizoctonia solani]
MSHKAVKLHGPMTTSKAVADGAVIWSIINSVSSRAPRYSFGAMCSRIALPWIGDHQGRKIYLGAHGLPVIPGAWSQVVHKGVALDSEAICRETYSNSYRSANPDLKSLSMDLYAYPEDDEPEWAWDEHENLLPIFRKVCTISADLRVLEGALERKVGLRGADYWELEISVCMRFGGTELEAFLEWKDKGVTRTGPVFIVPGDPVVAYVTTIGRKVHYFLFKVQSQVNTFLLPSQPTIYFCSKTVQRLRLNVWEIRRAPSGETSESVPQVEFELKDRDGFMEIELGNVKPRRQSATYLLAVICGHKFRFIDTPGFDNPYMSDAEVLTEIGDYFLDPGRAYLRVNGILYIHQAGDTLHSRALSRVFTVLSKHFLGPAGLGQLTILVACDNIWQADPAIIDEFHNPNSAFGEAILMGAHVEMFDPIRNGFQDALATYIKSHPFPSDTKIRSSTQSEAPTDSSGILFASSQLQLRENFEQSEVVQELKDLNRCIDDIGRSLSAYLTDKYVFNVFGRDISEVTALDAHNLPGLRSLLGTIITDPH